MRQFGDTLCHNLLIRVFAKKRVEAMPTRIFNLVNARALAVVCGCLTEIGMSGCAVVEDIHADGTTTRSIVLGTPVIMSEAPSSQSSIIKVTGLGLAVSNGATTLGWFDQSQIALDNDCRVVLVGNTEEELKTFVGLLPKKESVCADSKLNGGQQ